MSLEFADFAHHYVGSEISEAQQREHFETLASIMDCIVRFFWQDEPAANRLGIIIDGDTLALVDRIELGNPTTTEFNAAAASIAGKKET